MTRTRFQRLTVFVGPGHKRHASYDGRVLCGADQRKDRDGRLPMINHEQPFNADDVTCRRCQKHLPYTPTQ